MKKDQDSADNLKHFVASVIIMTNPGKITTTRRLSENLPNGMKSDDPVVLKKLSTVVLPDWLRSGMITSRE